MEEQYTYIIAPHTAHNYAVLAQAVSMFPELSAEQRAKPIWRKDAADLLDSDGGLLVPAGAQYILLKATTVDIDYTLLNEVEGYELYTVGSLPFGTYWL